MSTTPHAAQDPAGPEAFLHLMLSHHFPRLVESARVQVLVVPTDSYLFTVEPFRAGVVIRFASAATRRQDLVEIVHEAGTSAERHVHGLTTATRHQLDALDWWIWHQRQLPCSE